MTTPTDDDFEFFNLNPNPTQIRGYMTGVRNKAREEGVKAERAWICDHEHAIDLLKEALRGEGAYSRDPLEHAGNTIENMLRLIKKAIDDLTTQSEDNQN